MPLELAGITLAHLTQIATFERSRVARHAVPGLSGDLAQGLGRPSVVLEFRGLLLGPTARDELERLRAAHLDQQPVDLFIDGADDSDVVPTLYFSQVLVEELHVELLAGHPGEIVIAARVVEYVVPPEPAVAQPLAALDTDLAADAVGFVDDVQGALDEVSKLTDLMAATPSFGDPTQKLHGLVDGFAPLAQEGLGVLGSIRDLLAPPPA